jgi:probable addiction module antidote protein
LCGDYKKAAMTKPKTETHPWDITRYLDSDEAIAAYLDAVLEENDPALLAAALGDVARAKGMTQIARETGLGRESLYKALSSQGNPEFGTVMKVVRSFGLKLRVSA